MDYVKKDETTLQVTTTVAVQPAEVVKEYDLDFLKAQEVAILKQANDFAEARNVELAEVRELLAQCERLGIRGKAEVALELESAREADLKPVE